MFWRALLIIVTAMHAYVFARAATLPFVRGLWPRLAVAAVGIVLWGGFALARTMGHGGEGLLAAVVELLAMTWVAVLFLTFVPLLAVDVVTGFGFLLPRVAPWLRVGAFAAGGVLSLIALIQGLRPPVVRDYEVCLAGLPAEMDGTVLVAASDFHLGSLIGQRWLDARIAQVRALRPDIVVLLGDIFEGHGRPEAGVLASLGSLAAPLGVWAVHGNHESYGRGGGDGSPFDAAGIPTLRNRWVEVRPRFILAGVDNLSRQGGPRQADEAVAKALQGRPAGATVLLSHTPWGVEAAAKAGVGLMLSGHTHGGQVWPFGEFERHMYPVLAGRLDVGGMMLIVTRGAGTWGPRMRLWAPGEILRVTLRSGDSREPSPGATVD